MSNADHAYVLQPGRVRVNSPPGPVRIYLSFARQLALDFGRNSLTMFFVFVFPLAFLCIFEVGKLSQTVPSIRVALVEEAGSTSAFADFVRKHERLRVVTMSQADAESELRAGAIDVVLRESAEGEAGTTVHVLTKERGASDPILLTLESVKSRYLEVQTGAPHVAFAFSSMLGASSLDFSTYAIPAIIVLALIQLALFGAAGPLIAAREHNAFRHLFLAPVPVSLFLAAHVTVRLAVVILQVIVIVLMMSVVFGDRIYGSWITFSLVAAYGGIMLTAMGYMIGGLVPNQQVGALVLNLVNFGGIFLGQILADVSSNPYLGWVVRANPVTYFSDASRQVALNIRGLNPLSLDLTVIGIFTVIFAAITVVTFRRNFLKPLP